MTYSVRSASPVHGRPGAWSDRIRRRTRLLRAVFMVGFAVLTVRLFDLAFMTDPERVERARRQQGEVVELSPRRGKIVDRNGTLLAISRRMVSVYAHPRKVSDARGVARLLAPRVGRSEASIAEDLRAEKNFVWIARQVSPEVKDLLAEAGFEGVGTIPEHKRFYPQGSLASHVMGFVGLDGNGLEGIELAYEKTLRGKPSTFVITRDGIGNLIYDRVSDDYESEGQGLVLGLDSNVQALVDQKLRNGVKESGAKRGMALVMEPSSGQVLAWSVYPAFDPNRYRGLSPARWKNHPLADAIDPGSTLKAVLMAAAMETESYRESDTLYCENGSYQVYDRVIHDFKKHGWLTFHDVFQYSSNICAAKIGLQLGSKTLFEFVKRFGLGERSGIDLPGEIRGLVSNYKSWTPVDLANISFGQGIAVTPLQMLGVFGVFANGGRRMQPHLAVKVLDTHDRLVRDLAYPDMSRVVSEITARRVNAILQSVVSEKGTAPNAMVAGYRLAGKTGTAQKVDPATRTYSKDHYVASFVGFGPIQEPRAVVLVMVDEPRTSIYGGIVAAPIFRDIMSELLPYLGAFQDEGEWRTS